MEKTDTIILSPEELTAYIAESTISVTSTYEHSPVVLMVDDTVIGTLGNFSASIGKAKSKKTFNISAIVASALSGSTVLHYNCRHCNFSAQNSLRISYRHIHIHIVISSLEDRVRFNGYYYNKIGRASCRERV